MKLPLACFIFGIASIVPALAQQYNGITLIINNESEYPDDQVWLQWTGQGAGNGIAPGLHGISGSTSILPSDQNLGTPGAGINPNGYLLSSLAPLAGGKAHRYVIKNYTMDGGRINVTLGSSGINFTPNYTPPPNNFNDANNNFTRRYDKLEGFMQGSATDNIDMTAVDFFAIPFEVDAYNTPTPDPDNTTPVQSLTSANGSPIINALSSIASQSKRGAAQRSARRLAQSRSADQQQQPLSGHQYPLLRTLVGRAGPVLADRQRREFQQQLCPRHRQRPEHDQRVLPEFAQRRPHSTRQRHHPRPGGHSGQLPFQATQ